ncbi:hypothetical protein FQA39_LY10389 [Lamprigera yunnana]|nr:hypothetical protein FQA39_LY10389 [Lamprigera yunnana]
MGSKDRDSGDENYANAQSKKGMSYTEAMMKLDEVMTYLENPSKITLAEVMLHINDVDSKNTELTLFNCL